MDTEGTQDVSIDSNTDEENGQDVIVEIQQHQNSDTTIEQNVDTEHDTENDRIPDELPQIDTTNDEDMNVDTKTNDTDE